MKRLTKTKLIILLITITFLCGINKVGALECTYVLPYSGYDYYNDKMVSYGTESGSGANGRREIEVLDNDKGNNRFNNFLNVNGYAKLKYKKGDSTATFYTWLKNDDVKYLINQSFSDFDTCPKYVAVNYEKGSNKRTVMESSENDYIDFLKGSTYSAMLNALENQTFDTIVRNETDSKIVLPLFKDSALSVESSYYINIADNYNNLYLNKWNSILDNLSSDMSSACGSDWGKYVNISNYSDVANNKPNEFIEYLLSGTAKGKFGYYMAKNDEGLSEKCINVRKTRYIGTFITFYDYWYTLLQLDVEKEIDSVYTLANQLGNDDKYYNFETGEVGSYRNFYVLGIIAKNSSFFNKAVNIFDTPILGGSKRITDSQNTTSKEIENKYSNITANNDKINILSGDLCSGYCSSNTVGSTGYERCKAENSGYIACSNDLKECKNKCVCNQQNSTAQSECQKQCDINIKNCLVSANSEHSKALSDRDTKINELNSLNEVLQSEINNITTALTTFKYNPLESLPELNYEFTKYTPKCSDVEIFTDIWQAMRIIAPFLLIIFGSLDYFKAVIANDMEAMKKAKSKFPKRLIAFLLLILVPTIISIIMKAGTNGAENTTYFRCIVTGDKGDDN